MTKITTLFIFDRVTGEPIYGIEERPVPKSTVPGEASWPTQPFPLKPAPLGRTTFDPAKDFYGLDAGPRGLLQGPLGQERDVHARAVHAAGPRGLRGDVPEHARRRQLERPRPTTARGTRLHQRDEPGTGRADGPGRSARRRRTDLDADHSLGRRGRPVLESREQDPVLGPAVRRAGGGRREQGRDRVESAPRVHRIAQGARASATRGR